jgi:hypothetical protein
MESIIIQLQMTLTYCYLPPVPDQHNTNIIDHFLNLLPTDHTEMQESSSHWQRTWPLILSALLTIDINSHPEANFDNESTDHPWLTTPTST